MTEAGLPAPASLTAIKPSPMWTASIVAVVVLALLIGAAAFLTSIRATQFIGEGELLFDDAARAATLLGGLSGDPDALTDELKRIRNDLGIEAVSYVGPGGSFIASTSPTLIGLEAGGMLIEAAANGRFAAVAAPLSREVLIDGVTEWEVGDVLYDAMHPIDDGAVILSYDVSELFHRRITATQIPPQVVPMSVLSGTLMLVAAGLATARSRVTRSRREMAMEAGFLRRQSEDLQIHNEQLEMARAETEAALALAEEKNRIRSEFVLMINHELRTPLTGVVTGARLLRQAPLDVASRQILDDMIHDGDRLESMIGQILAVARVENRGLSVVSVEMSVSDLVARLGRAISGADPTVQNGLLEEGTTVVTDATTLAQLVASLADNSFIHGAKRVDVSLSRQTPDQPHLVVGEVPAHSLHVIVSDDGPGIDPDFLPEAFEKFRKSGHSSGTGLGLHFCKMMAESIGASISVHTSSTGTWMAVSIPARLPVEAVGSEAAS